MRVPFYQVDAFASGPFTGNPAAVMLFDEYPPDAQMLAIAAENNLSETAFVVPRGERYQIRWFTPTVEIDLCGHATLASAFVLWHYRGAAQAALEFECQVGTLKVTREGDLLVLDFPARPMTERFASAAIDAALGLAQPPLASLGRDGRFLLEVESKATVLALAPSMAELARAAPAGPVYVTARGDQEDFVCRVFIPAKGIDEDPVTGSAYTALAPYWAQKLGKQRLFARQLSRRGGELWCELSGDRVLIKGIARGVITGEFEVAP